MVPVVTAVVLGVVWLSAIVSHAMMPVDNVAPLGALPMPPSRMDALPDNAICRVMHHLPVGKSLRDLVALGRTSKRYLGLLAEVDVPRQATTSHEHTRKLSHVFPRLRALELKTTVGLESDALMECRDLCRLHAPGTRPYAERRAP